MIEWKDGDDFQLVEGMVVRCNDGKEYQALPATPKGSCLKCEGADSEGFAEALCLKLPPCSRMVEGQESQIPEVNCIWVDVSDVAY